MPDARIAAYGLNTVYLPNEAFATAGPTTGYNNGTLFTVPLNEAAVYELTSVSLSPYQVAIDATDVITMAIKTVSAAGAAGSTLVSAASVKSTAVADKAAIELWRGRVQLTAGMSVEWELTATTPDTAGFGYAITCEGRFVERSGV